MYVRIADGTAAVEELDNLRALEVRTAGAAPDAVAAALAAAGLGTVEGDHAWLSIPALRERGADLGDAWADGFDGMIAYAASNGWVGDDGTTVRAHLA